MHSIRAFRPSAAATAFALIAVAACSDSPTKGGSNGTTPAAIAISSGNDQVGVPGTPLAAPIAVRVTNAQGNPLSGKVVDFAVTRGAGSVATATVTTDNNGVAQTAWTLGSGTVRQEVKATVNSLVQAATATVDTTRSLFLLPTRDTVSVNDTIWVSVIAGTSGLNGEVRGAVQETFVNKNPNAAQLVKLYYFGSEQVDLAGTNANFAMLTSDPTNASARQRYFLLGYVASRAGQDIQFEHAASGFIAARTFTDLLNRVSVVGAVVHVR